MGFDSFCNIGGHGAEHSAIDLTGVVSFHDTPNHIRGKGSDGGLLGRLVAQWAMHASVKRSIVQTLDTVEFYVAGTKTSAISC